MIRVPIAAASGAYEAMIENGLIDRAGAELRKILGDRQLFVITVPPVRRRWGKRLMRSLESAGFKARLVQMPDGEPAKRLATVERLAGQLLKLGADRDAVLIAFGGGVVGDVAGLLASLYMRGVSLVQIPTTVLAQVDASIGGKTGVNLAAGKNLLGTFHPPLTVLIDPGLLKTLPEREFRAGMYEALKCGVIGRPGLFNRIESTGLGALRRDSQALEWVIAESAKLKTKIVSADERESGLRRVLNFGHTIGHALEAESHYRRFLHGEAVAWGMIAATWIARKMDFCGTGTEERVIQAVLSFGPLPKVRARSRDILKLVQSDKKAREGQLHFVLPREIGSVEVVRGVPEKLVSAAVDELRRLSNLA